MSLNVKSLLVREKQKQLLVFVLFLFLCLCIYFCICWKSFWRHCGVVQRLLLQSCDGDWTDCPQAQASPQINSGQETILSIPKVGLQDCVEFPHKRPFYPLCPNLSDIIKSGKKLATSPLEPLHYCIRNRTNLSFLDFGNIFFPSASLQSCCVCVKVFVFIDCTFPKNEW